PVPEPESVVLPEPVAADAEPAVPEPAAAWEPEPGPEKASSATAVFARLHESVAQGSPSDGDPTDEPHEPSADELAFQHRTEALAPIEAELAKRLKRALADEQNEVLDALRRTSPTGAADLLQSADQHAARWAEVVSASLVAAAKAGADYGTGKAGSTKDLAKQLAATLTGPLRDRIDRSFEAADGDLDAVADRVRALYREWKMQRLPEVGTTHVVAAYARGLFDAANKGAKVRWVVDPSRPPCPDCDDNVLAGVVVKGEEFPTGNANAPAHPGCHCLVLVHEDVLLTD
ncbi:MAG: hypothetical protein M3Z03_13745, partial [Actinomycetota bacterium]|nr:hypothetical protein [Actinomycetota bacterium]